MYAMPHGPRSECEKGIVKKTVSFGELQDSFSSQLDCCIGVAAIVGCLRLLG